MIRDLLLIYLTGLFCTVYLTWVLDEAKLSFRDGWKYAADYFLSMATWPVVYVLVLIRRRR